MLILVHSTGISNRAERLVLPTAGSGAPPYGGAAEAVSIRLAQRDGWSFAAKLCCTRACAISLSF